ncbi:hypothetical protein [Roseicyclus mahoneyensis]|uniref:Uncharacterized protein n=1 Tax=Roseicyclus mahoneyensis TaxID=164332 RepID=A0A316G541_9RHOB|nr:hypothetical protein [Roseicyclus mahoneyensis]PWK54890.1 hypothetical protein C7455_1235 [Roseicyclus mahoneyensis]
MTREPSFPLQDLSVDAQRARADEVVLRLVGLLARQVVRDELSGAVSNPDTESHHDQTDEA